MDERILVLKANILRDLDAIAGIYRQLESCTLADGGDETVVVAGYYLHNLYNAFENMFQNIAAVFENSVDDMGRWHAQLLERMRLDVMPLRPAVIDDEAYDALDELRRFRHLFRHAYGVKLDSSRLELVMRKARVLKALYEGQVGRFVAFLEEMS